MGTAVGAVITEPTYLVYIGFTTPIRHSTRANVSFDAQTWVAGEGTEVEYVDEDRAVIALRNTDNSASALVLNTVLSDIECAVYQAYGSDVVQLFDGFLDGAGDIGDRKVVLNAVARSRARYAPDDYILYPVFNHLLPAGYEIRWGGDILVLDRPD